MIRFLSVLIIFLRELIFDSKEEYNIKSSSFNTRKFIVFILLLLSILSTFIITIKVYYLAVEIILLNEKIDTCNNKLK